MHSDEVHYSYEMPLNRLFSAVLPLAVTTVNIVIKTNHTCKHLENGGPTNYCYSQTTISKTVEYLTLKQN